MSKLLSLDMTLESSLEQIIFHIGLSRVCIIITAIIMIVIILKMIMAILH